MTDQPDKTCPVCLKPETAISGGFVTSFIDVCHCKSIRFQPSEEAPAVQLCGNCHKAITQGQREGSLTQWIFRFDSCKCELPNPVTVAPRVAAPGSQQYHSDANGDTQSSFDDDDHDTELVVSKDQFPTERYIPLAILGKGASGIVYLAKDRLLKKKVAVKILINLTGEQLIDFQNEAKLTSRLKHPNIIQVYDFGPTPSGMPYMVLEYSERVLSLAQSIRENGPLDVDVAIQVFSKVADALAFAHGMGIYHRDLKPSNILFTYLDHQDINVKLIDFGVASIRRESLEPTQSDKTTVVGTLGYMAPELASDKQFDTGCEIYSLGCVLFEALTGRLPFNSDSPLEMLALHTNQKAPPLHAVAGIAFPVQIEQLVSDCLSKDPEARPASATVVNNRLQRCKFSIDASRAGDHSALNVVDHAVKTKNKSGIKTVFVSAAALVSISWVMTLIITSNIETPKAEKTLTAKKLPVLDIHSGVLADQIYGTELNVENTDLVNLTAPNAADITSIRITRCKIKDPSALSGAANFPKLRKLSITSTTGLSKSVVEGFSNSFSKIASDKRKAKAKNLLENPLFVDFSDTDLDNSGLIPLQKIPSIVSLTLAGTKVDDDAVTSIASLNMIQAVDLSRTAISDNGIEKLVTIPSLVLLRVFSCPNLQTIKASTVMQYTTIVVERPQTDIDDEFPIFFQASQAKNIRAYSKLATLYYIGKGVDRDFDEALKWYKKGALAGSAASQLSVGDFYRLGLVGKRRNTTEALKWYQMAASNGERIKAADRIGTLYHQDENYKEALKYFRIAADAGSASAQVYLGAYYNQGYGVTVNQAESFKWYQKAAKQGASAALYTLGSFYQTGTGVKHNDALSFKYYSLAAEAGDEDAMYNLGCYYKDGTGTARDTSKAMQFFRAAANKGNLEAAASIGYLYENGIGVDRDYNEAFKWYKRGAAGDENSNALLALGELYRYGKGVAANPELARTYYQRAAVLGNEKAKQRLRN